MSGPFISMYYNHRKWACPIKTAYEPFWQRISISMENVITYISWVTSGQKYPQKSEKN